MTINQDIETLIRAKYPILYTVTWEEKRVEEMIKALAKPLNRTVHVWSISQGLQTSGQSTPQTKTNLPPELEILGRMIEAAESSIYILKDFHPYLKDFRVVRLLRDLAAKLRSRAQTIVIIAPSLNLPQELEKDVTVIDFPLPSAEEIRATLESILEALKGNDKVDISLTEDEKETVVRSALGLTLEEVESVFARSVVQTKSFDVSIILAEKQQLIRKSGLLEYYPAVESLSDVGGMEFLKEWLTERKDCFSDRAKAFGLPAPKGVLLLGVQGCGKSLLAKAIAANWKLPMLRLDIGRIFGSYVGQSEDNIRKAIKVSESVAPCVLWADELEKGFGGLGGSNTDGGTTSRVFATFLTWMQEKTAPVFLIATANDVSKLPPEMLRKGRFDEIFFIDLPDRPEREEILAIHLRKRNRDPSKYDLLHLSDRSRGFSGAELEQVVVGSLYRAFAENREIDQKDLEYQVEHLVPLSVMMEENMASLREWASKRTRPASRFDG